MPQTPDEKKKAAPSPPDTHLYTSPLILPPSSAIRSKGNDQAAPGPPYTHLMNILALPPVILHVSSKEYRGGKRAAGRKLGWGMRVEEGMVGVYGAMRAWGVKWAWCEGVYGAARASGARRVPGVYGAARTSGARRVPRFKEWEEETSEDGDSDKNQKLGRKAGE
ncbi:hypothetical protein B0H10DRAFT_2186856 [Mycena sp. CBHHK59/15]|nr:hypothetical protein B0H10DRAFT_2186856 [Mycena sp. CBHHK59/15]